MTRKRVITCVLLNLVATPGLGSLMAQRRAEGIGQIGLSLAGFVMMMVWFFAVMKSYYHQMFAGEGTTHETIGLQGLAIGGGLFALAWVWTLFTSLSLLRHAKNSEAEEIKILSAPPLKLDEMKIPAALAALPLWKRDGQTIARTFEFADFLAAMKFVNAVAEIAEAAQHHPNVDIRWNKVALALTTHDAGGLTDKDFALARRCDALARA
jgi:4a-hydroxytetrahydrobiopterin dehydratase